MISYNNFEGLNVDKTTFNKDILLNGIIKLNDYQVCYCSIDPGKIYLKLVVFTFYKNDELMNVRYYQIEIWTSCTIEIYSCIKLIV